MSCRLIGAIGLCLFALGGRTLGQVAATGGNTTDDVGGYRIHTFTSSGTLSVSAGGYIEVLVVAGGGGGGGYYYGGGGGAGGFVTAMRFLC